MALNACGPLGNDTSGGGSKRSPLTRARSATVTVLNHSNGKTYQSSGVVYDTSLGRVLTSATAVWDRDSLEVVTRDGRKVPARLVARSPCGDLAVLILDPKPAGLTAVHLASSGRLKGGAPLTALGFVPGEGGAYRPSESRGGVTASNASVALDKTLPPHPSLVEHQAPLTPTLAGGPVVDSSGDLVGIDSVLNTYGDAPDAPAELSFAASSDYVRSRIDELKPTTSSQYRGWETEHECHMQFQAVVRKHRGTEGEGGGMHMDSGKGASDHMK